MDEKQKSKLSDWYNEVSEPVGLFYGGFMILGAITGGALAFWVNGGVSEFLEYGWINALVGIGVGGLIGLSLGLITNGILVFRKR